MKRCGHPAQIGRYNNGRKSDMNRRLLPFLAWIGAAAAIVSACGAEPTDLKSSTIEPAETTLPIDTKPPVSLQPTSSCPPEAVAELERVSRFVSGHSWTNRPVPSYGMLHDTTQCRVRVRSDQLLPSEEKALQAEGGQYLVIEHVPPPKRR